MVESDFKFKICLLGEGSVGKTSLVYRLVENQFQEDYKATLGVNMLQKHLDIDGQSVSTNIWDLGGQDSFKNLRKLYLRDNQFASLPVEACKLHNLQELYLQNNQLIYNPSYPNFFAFSIILEPSIILINTAGLPLYIPHSSVSPINKLPAVRSTPTLKREPGNTIAFVPTLENLKLKNKIV